MKYFVLLIVLIVIILVKPWEMSFAGGVFSVKSDTSLIPPPSLKPLPLLAINHVINNSDSDFPETDRFDRIIERFLAEWDLQGASFALMKDDKLIYSKGYGYADREADLKADVKHIFRVASVSKLITAIGIMKLVEEKKLRLDGTVFGPGGILADSCFTDIRDNRSRDITIEHLLRHQAGFSISAGDPMFCPVDIAQKMNVTAPADLNTMIQFVLSRRLRYTPGTGTLYSNIGYGILSKVIEKVSGEKYESYIQKNILQPAGCFDMHLGRNLYENKFPNEVRYYEVANAEPIVACDGSNKLLPKSYGGNNIEELYGAGGWVASPAELLRLMATIDGDSTIVDILKPTSINRMTQYVKNALPIGWIDVSETGDWSRTGTLAGTSALIKKQNDGYSWAFVTNTSSWKGAKFHHYIDATITKAMGSVSEWPKRDLFELQRFNHEKLFVTR